MHFTGVVTPGDILVATTIAVSVIGAYTRIISRLDKMEERFSPMYRWWDRHINSGNGLEVRGNENGD